MIIQNAEKYIDKVREDYVSFRVPYTEFSAQDRETINAILAKRQISDMEYQANFIRSQEHLEQLRKEKEKERQRERDKYN